MARLEWNGNGYSTGVDRGVYFPQVGPPEAWTGLISVQESPSDLNTRIVYQDGVKILNRRREDSFSATIEAYTYPESLSARTEFGFSYRVNTDTGYRTHLVYRAKAKPSQRSYKFDETSTFSFDISTTPVPIPGVNPSAHLIIDTDFTYSGVVTAFEDILYGTQDEDPRLPSPEEIFDLFEVNSELRVTDNGDGTFTVDGPDSAIQMLDDTTFQITWPSAIFIDAESYTIRSL